MDGEVVGLFRERHSSGDAMCRDCGFEFEAVVPAGLTHFECINCHRHTAVFKHLFGAQADEYEFTCDCGGHDFYIFKKTVKANGQIRCRNCGEEAVGWFE